MAGDAVPPCLFLCFHRGGGNDEEVEGAITTLLKRLSTVADTAVDEFVPAHVDSLTHRVFGGSVHVLSMIWDCSDDEEDRDAGGGILKLIPRFKRWYEYYERILGDIVGDSDEEKHRCIGSNVVDIVSPRSTPGRIFALVDMAVRSLLMQSSRNMFSDGGSMKKGIELTMEEVCVARPDLPALTSIQKSFAHKAVHLLTRKQMKARSSQRLWLSTQNDDTDRTVKSLPDDPAQGLTVFEFFSGIGGMRLGLPHTIRGHRVSHIVAWDIAPDACDTYEHNFRGDNGGADARNGCRSTMRRVNIDGLKPEQLDGEADVWTLSPPCQPYTRTRGAKRADASDNRSSPLFRLGLLLLSLRIKPRWIVLENVAAFVGSEGHGSWTRALRKAGYTWRQYTLSPITCGAGIPNHRMRLYMIAEYGDRFEGEGAEVCTALRTGGVDPKQSSEGKVRPISDFLLPPCIQHRESLFLPDSVLADPRIAPRLSIIGPGDRTSFCFTKGYSRIYDRATGSCLLEDDDISLSLGREEGKYLDRTCLVPRYSGRIRRFDPSELLLLFGFPRSFSWPKDLSYEKWFALIGNSVNVVVVRLVMRELFVDSQ